MGIERASNPVVWDTPFSDSSYPNIYIESIDEECIIKVHGAGARYLVHFKGVVGLRCYDEQISDYVCGWTLQPSCAIIFPESPWIREIGLDTEVQDFMFSGKLVHYALLGANWIIEVLCPLRPIISSEQAV